MATEQLSDNLVIPGLGISAQIVIQWLYDCCTWTILDGGSHSRIVETNVRLFSMVITGMTVSVSQCHKVDPTRWTRSVLIALSPPSESSKNINSWYTLVNSQASGGSFINTCQLSGGY